MLIELCLSNLELSELPFCIFLTSKGREGREEGGREEGERRKERGAGTGELVEREEGREREIRKVHA